MIVVPLVVTIDATRFTVYFACYICKISLTTKVLMHCMACMVLDMYLTASFEFKGTMDSGM